MSAKKPITTGTRYGRLVVIKEAVKRAPNGAVKYICDCDCGQQTIANGACLRAGKWKSCGCLRKEAGYAKRLPPGIAGFNALYESYKRQAKYRGHAFHLNKYDFGLLTRQRCTYCDVEPKSIKRSRADSLAEPYIYNGIDRINNKKGYTLHNCVPCCALCNRMKRDLTTKQFLDHIENIFTKLIDLGEKYHDGK